MARVLVLTDRLPNDDDWKGALAWQIIRGLAESQHEVLVWTTVDPVKIDVQHPRLSIGRIAPAWRAAYLPRIIQGLLSFSPEVIHTFAFKPSSLWPKLSAWPYLNGVSVLLPGTRRYSTFFEASDADANPASLVWHQASTQCSTFTSDQARTLAGRHGLRCELLPLEGEAPLEEIEESERYVLVPAPVPAWRKELERLKDFLLRHPELRARIVGGWGDMAASERREGWRRLAEVADRISLLEPLDYLAFRRQVAGAESVWTEGLTTDSWRAVAATLTAQACGRPLRGPAPRLEEGSPANFLSRLYAQKGPGTL